MKQQGNVSISKMEGIYMSCDGVELLGEERGYESNFYLGILGSLGAVDIDNGNVCDGLSFAFHSEHTLTVSAITFTFEKSDQVFLIVHHQDEKYYLQHSNYEGSIILEKNKPSDPLFIEPVENQPRNRSNEPTLFYLRNSKSRFGVFSGGAYYFLVREEDDDDTAVFYFLREGPPIVNFRVSDGQD